MKRTALLKSLTRKNDTKMALLVMDGLGGLPGPEGMTELEAAVKPNFDKLVLKSELGMLDIV
ncbi:MAG: phosphoglycerate mutase, partial [Synergistaceae bacterium]|nr:phosphoglycerate mutase [Synergistaceae bacterium]